MAITSARASWLHTRPSPPSTHSHIPIPQGVSTRPTYPSCRVPLSTPTHAWYLPCTGLSCRPTASARPSTRRTWTAPQRLSIGQPPWQPLGGHGGCHPHATVMKRDALRARCNDMLGLISPRVHRSAAYSPHGTGPAVAHAVGPKSKSTSTVSFVRSCCKLIIADRDSWRVDAPATHTPRRTKRRRSRDATTGDRWPLRTRTTRRRRGEGGAQPGAAAGTHASRSGAVGGLSMRIRSRIFISRSLRSVSRLRFCFCARRAASAHCACGAQHGGCECAARRMKASPVPAQMREG